MKLKQITDYLEKIAPLSLQEQYDNSGLITGDAAAEVSQALVCIDCTEEVLEEAIQKGCELLISHHPVIFKGLKKLTGATYSERALIKAIQNRIAIYAMHTNLDNVQGGVNAMLCEKIGLINCRTLLPKKNVLKKLFTFCPPDKADEVRQALFAAGCGQIGEYDECSFNTEGFGTFHAPGNTNPYVGKKNKQNKEQEIRIESVYPVHAEREVLKALFASHPYDEVAYDIVALENSSRKIGAGMIGELKEEHDEMDFLKEVKANMNTACIRHTKPLGRKVKKVAVCGGSGSFLLQDAISSGADVFITSDLKYHQFFDAEDKILIADIGHYESEQFTKELIARFLKEKFSTFAVHLSEINTNPVNYL